VFRDAYDKYRMDVLMSGSSGVPGNNKTYAMAAIFYLVAAIFRRGLGRQT
jgi:hypothetical protein